MKHYSIVYLLKRLYRFSLAVYMGRNTKKKLSLHQKIKHHLTKHCHRHIHQILHVTNFVHHQIFHGLELVVVTIVTLTSFGFTSLTWLNQDLYRDNFSDVSEHLLAAMQNPTSSLKQGNIISVWTINMDIENTFAKWYCTYGAARFSPEFFPFIDPSTQQRTWWGNAVDRCKNAAETWYKIWLTPSQWALIVYEAGGRFGIYGHVGKVLHYDKSRNKIIVRDMARVGRWSMSDRREDLSTANVKCYIYNSKTTISTPTDNTGTIVYTGSTITTGTLPTIDTPTSTTWTISKPTVVTPEVPVISPIIPQAKPSAPEVLPPVQEPVQPNEPIISQNAVNQKLPLTFDYLSDIAQHFITQNDITFTLTRKTPLLLGEVATLTLEIKDKNTGEPYSGLLPFSFTLLSTNDSIQSDIASLQMLSDWTMDISILGQKIWLSTMVILMDGTKIGAFSVEVK